MNLQRKICLMTVCRKMESESKNTLLCVFKATFEIKTENSTLNIKGKCI